MIGFDRLGKNGRFGNQMFQYAALKGIARNIGAMKCNTDLVAFLDSDIVLFKDYYEKILNYFKLYDDLIAIQGLDINLIFFQFLILTF